MIAPVFEEIEPASDCDCPGCVLGRRTAPRPSPGGFLGRPVARGAAVVGGAGRPPRARPPARAPPAG
ncbi:hypothetical protein ACFVZ6_04210, partial [Streptomyces sp. NPDC059597]